MQEDVTPFNKGRGKQETGELEAWIALSLSGSEYVKYNDTGRWVADNGCSVLAGVFTQLHISLVVAQCPDITGDTRIIIRV